VQKKSPRTSRQRFAQRKSGGREPAVNVVEDVVPRLRRGVGSRMRRRSLMHGRQSHRHWREALLARALLPCRCGSVNHGGLTPPAPGAHAFVHRKSRNFAGKRSHSDARAAGVSPPWFRERACKGNRHAQAGGDSPETRVARVSPPWVWWYRDCAGARQCVGRMSPEQLRHAAARAFREPRGADAPRSCACAFVHRKSRNFAGKRSHSDARAAGVSPPWFRERACKGNRHAQAGGDSPNARAAGVSPP
jgi:hypothetical protein